MNRLICMLAFAIFLPGVLFAQENSLVPFFERLQPKMVKIYGAGGLKGLESYQSGFFVSDQGHIVTSWSTVLDVEKIRVVTFDGKKWEATMVGMDPVLELAILKIEADGFPFFSLNPPIKAEVGDRVFGITNLFGIAAGNEENSVQKGNIMGISTLAARRGRMRTPYQGPVYMIDVMSNNPGATGGAIVNLRGDLVAIVGKELKDDATGTWMNYGIPVTEATDSIVKVIEGKSLTATEETKLAERPHRLLDLGIVMVPDVLPKTPPFVDSVVADSLAAKFGLRADDLVLIVNGQRVDSRQALERILATIDRADPLNILVQRNDLLHTIEIRP